MKHGKTLLALLLLAAMLLTVCAPSAALAAPASQSAGRPLAVRSGELVPTRVQTTMFRAKFEGSAVAGSGEEKGLGAMFGLLSTPSGQYVEYVTYAKQDTDLVIQLSLGTCAPPNSIILDHVKVEKAGNVDLVSDTIYTF